MIVTNYNEYQLTIAEKLKYTVAAAAVLSAAGFIFFRNPYICVIFCLFSVVYPVYKRNELIKKRKNDLIMQFKDMLYSISSSLSAGRSVESAFKIAQYDLRLLYPDEDTYIIKELELINRRIDLNETIECILLDFSKRADIDDITGFAEVFSVCKNTGGNLVEVIKNTSDIISQKIEIKNEMDILVSEQKFSQKVLNIMPFILISLISLGSPDYLAPLYSIKGNMIMLIVMLMLASACLISSKITDIRI